MHTCTQIKNSLYYVHMRDARSIRHERSNVEFSIYAGLALELRFATRGVQSRSTLYEREGGGVDMPRAQRYRGICVRREMTADQLLLL